MFQTLLRIETVWLAVTEHEPMYLNLEMLFIHSSTCNEWFWIFSQAVVNSKVGAFIDCPDEFALIVSVMTLVFS